MEYLLKGGIFMWPILAISVAVLALVLERVFALWLRYRLDEQGFLRGILNAVDQQDFAGALEECAREAQSPLARVCRAGLLKAHRRDREIESAMEEEMLRAVPQIRKRISYLSSLANIATLLGLLGTIQGLIQAFEGVGVADAATRQEILAQGISVAMLTTAFGLIVAIPTLMAHSLLQGRATRMIESVEEKALALFNRISALHRDLETSDVKLRMKAVEGGRRG